MDGAVLTLVINKLSDLLEQKVALIAGAEDEIRSLRYDLSMLTIFLRRINDQSDGTYTDLVQELVDQLQRVSWKAEDVVDHYLVDVARHQRRNSAKKIFTGSGMLLRKGKLAAQARDIKLTIDRILSNQEKYRVLLDNVTPSVMTAPRHGENALDRRRRNVEEEDVVGFDQRTYEVMEMLMPKGGVEAEGLRVVSITGMGGLGKTTLARKIFRSEEISKHFETKVWVVVSEHVEARHVLKNILQYLNVNIKKDDDEYLKEKLKEQLDGTTYLIVLDDLWTPEQWKELKFYLSGNQKRGSRILLTSRIENVANVASTDSTTYHLNPLGDADSWSLFCRKALKGEECPSNLKNIGKSIVSKCKGLPLAIIVLGSLLAEAEATPSFKYWSMILGDTSWHPDAGNDCSKILSLSYRNLPPHLRTCFLYVGVFPEDFEIAARELCLLWVAEGFVKGQGNKLEEDEAEQCLIKLADRNLIMISKRRSDGGIKLCRIHDLLRDLCVKEAERCNLFKVDVVGDSQNAKEGIRKLALHKSDRGTLLPPPLYEGLRTFFDFTNNNISNMRSVFKDLYVMRVLHLQGYKGVIQFAKNMILLRYLKTTVDPRRPNIGLSIIRTRDISNLSNLQVLILIVEGLVNLPKGIWKLKLLRHIYVRGSANMPDAQSSHDSLPFLQTLSCIAYQEHTSKMLSTDRFPSLRKLFIEIICSNLFESHQWRAESVQPHTELLHLVSLKIWYCVNEWESSGPLNVFTFSSTLTKIHLKNICFTSEHWRSLGKLKNLQVLKLSSRKSHTSCEEESFLDQPLVFEAEAFPQLIHLKLMTRHQALILEDGALRTLQYLIIRARYTESYPGLSALPDQLWLSNTLRQVKLIRPSQDLKKYIQHLDDSQRSKVTISHSRL